MTGSELKRLSYIHFKEMSLRNWLVLLIFGVLPQSDLGSQDATNANSNQAVSMNLNRGASNITFTYCILI